MLLLHTTLSHMILLIATDDTECWLNGQLMVHLYRASFVFVALLIVVPNLDVGSASGSADVDNPAIAIAPENCHENNPGGLEHQIDCGHRSKYNQGVGDYDTDVEEEKVIFIHLWKPCDLI